MPKAPKKDKSIVLSEEEKAAKDNVPNANSTMQSMTMLMPFISAWFTFTLPAAVGVYWILSNIIQMLQHIFVTRYLGSGISDNEIEGEINNVKSRKNRKKRK